MDGECSADIESENILADGVSRESIVSTVVLCEGTDSKGSFVGMDSCVVEGRSSVRCWGGIEVSGERCWGGIEVSGEADKVLPPIEANKSSSGFDLRCLVEGFFNFKVLAVVAVVVVGMMMLLLSVMMVWMEVTPVLEVFPAVLKSLLVSWLVRGDCEEFLGA